MDNLINTTNFILGTGTVLIQILSITLLVGIITRDRNRFYRLLSEKTLKIITIIGFASMAGSLFYSEIIGYPPCALCWYQRIFLYSIAFIGITAIIKKTGSEVLKYIKTLSIIGLIIALYHTTIRFVDFEPIPCSANGPSCLQELFLQFGYIDIPMMSASALLLIILLIANNKRF